MEKVSVYSFPFAAGSRYSYNPFVEAAPDWMHWVSFDYPGRGRRLFEKPLLNLRDIVDDLKQVFDKNLQTPYVFYGHSMGTLVAYLLTVDFWREGRPLPQHLFLSGRGGACIAERRRNALEMSREEIIQEIREMDGDLAALEQNPRLFDLYENVVRADVAALETYDYQQTAGVRLPVPATVFIGDRDIYTPDEAALWQTEFARPIQLHTLPGGHFFLFEHVRFILKTIEDNLSGNSYHDTKKTDLITHGI